MLIRFSPNWTSWPFDRQSEDDWDLHLGLELTQEIKDWNQSFLEHFDEIAGEFPSQADRAAFDRKYLELINKLRERGLYPDISMWW